MSSGENRTCDTMQCVWGREGNLTSVNVKFSWKGGQRGSGDLEFQLIKGSLPLDF